MNTKIFSVVLFTSLLVGSLTQAADLRVISSKPEGELRYPERTTVSVTFNQPVTALSDEAAFSSEDCPLKITPAVAGGCRFSGTQTLQFEPEQDWPLATSYQVTLPAGFTSAVSGQKLERAYSFSFDTQRPHVSSVLPSNKEQWIDVRPLIFVTLNQPVDLTAAENAVRVSYEGSISDDGWWERIKSYITGKKIPQRKSIVNVPTSVRSLTDEEFEKDFSYQHRDHIFVVQLQQDLPPHTKVNFHISRTLRSQAGPLEMAGDFNSVFYTYPSLQIVGGNFEGCLPMDAELYFSSPVRLADLLQHMTVSPQTALSESLPWLCKHC